MSKRKKSSLFNNKFIEPIVLLSTLIFVLLFWNSPIIYPIKLLVIFFHEMSHALFTIFTGGNVISMDIFFDLSGGVVSEGGNQFFIASAGYIGSVLFGILVFISPSQKRYGTIILTIISAIIILFTANFLKSELTLFIMTVFGILFFVSPRYFPKEVNFWIMKIIGLIASLYIVFDIKQDLLTLAYRETDAQKLEMITNVPAIFWGLLWFVLTIGIIGFTLYKEFKLKS